MRLIPKREMLQIVGVKSFTTVWQWMREGTFPLGLAIGARTMWRSDEIEQWLEELPARRVKEAEEKSADHGKICAYHNQKGAAKDRGIEWLFTYETWVKWWEDKLGKEWMQLRGCQSNQYVMARHGDRGPYSPENVVCITAGENNREALLRRHSPAKPQLISNPKIGLNGDKRE